MRHDLLIVRGREVLELLAGRETDVLHAVRAAYESHGRGETSLPHSTFLRFPLQPRDRIIALPAFLGGEAGVAGLKWISSFPGNLERGLERAAASLILNSTETGRPEALMEASIISAQRTAASAALAARVLDPEGSTARVGFVGCGLINFEIVRYLRVTRPEVSALLIYDVDARRAEQFRRQCLDAFSGLEVEIATDTDEVFRCTTLVSLATTAARPHISDLSACAPGTTILHVSLRDLAPELILACDNVVDAADHVCREQTSLHLTEQLTGGRDFIRCSLPDVLLGASPPRRDPFSTVVFSPFGLGILDLAVGRLVRDLALEQRKGTLIDSFLPEPWTERQRPGIV